MFFQPFCFLFLSTPSLYNFSSQKKEKKRKEKKRKEKSLQFSIFQLQTYIIKYVSSFKPGTSQDFDLEVQNLNQIFFFHYRIINTQNFKTKLIHQK